MYISTVTYGFPCNRGESEQYCLSLKEAVAFADSVIEDGGFASVSTEEPFDTAAMSYSLCDIYPSTS